MSEEIKNSGLEGESPVKDVIPSEKQVETTTTSDNKDTMPTQNKELPQSESTAPSENTENKVENKVENKITFTKEQQDEINRITSKRVNEVKEKTTNDLLAKYGFKEFKELETALGKNQSYDTLKSTYESEHAELINLREENALIKNNIDPSSYDIVKNYFKGAKTDLNADALAKMLKDNQVVAKQWVKHNQITNLGVQANESSKKDDYATWRAKVMGNK